MKKRLDILDAMLIINKENFINELDLTNEFKINKYVDISKKETQKEYEKFGITPDIVYIQAINAQKTMITSLCELLEFSQTNNDDDEYTKIQKQIWRKPNILI